jgi:signal transduction histidine kinase
MTDSRQLADSMPFPGTSIMAARCRAFDWSATSLGPPSTWPQGLRALVAQTLESRYPMLLWWGPELIQIFNDGFLPSLGAGGGDISALGARGREHWADAWPIVGPQIEGVLERGEATWYEDQLIPIERNGRMEDVWWWYSYSPVRTDDGRINGVLVVVHETTKRVTLERQLERERGRLLELLAHAPAFICVLSGPEHVFEMANVAYQQLIGFRDVVGLPVRAAIPEAESQGFVALLDHVLATGETYVGTQVPVALRRSPDHAPEQRILTFVYQAITEEDGTRSGVFVHGVDVTDSVQARALAESASRAKSDFLAVMSHELRTPLNAIGGYADLMEMGIHGPLTDAQRVAIGRIQNSQRHLLGLINQVLNYARIESGVLSYDITDVAVRDALVGAEQLVSPQLRTQGLSCIIDPCDAGVVVRADTEKLRQILLNLLSNAIKFTPRGGEIRVTCESGDTMATIAVRDTGIGIETDKLASIFEPFVQVDSNLTRTGEGVGLGLAISRDLARGMGGDLTAESVRGEGSVFRLRLPRMAVGGQSVR